MARAFVTPKSKKARNRFANKMNNNPECIIEQNHTNRLFLNAVGGENCFWVDIPNDSNWEVKI